MVFSSDHRTLEAPWTSLEAPIKPESVAAAFVVQSIGSLGAPWTSFYLRPRRGSKASSHFPGPGRSFPQWEGQGEAEQDRLLSYDRDAKRRTKALLHFDSNAALNSFLLAQRVPWYLRR